MEFYEIDFLGVAPKSGDAITLRYSIDGENFIHVIDGGYQATGENVIDHIKKHYGNPFFIDHVVATHNDGDHCGGLRSVLEEFEVGALWMLCPWNYADELVHRFARFTNPVNLAKRLRDIYSNLAALEDIAKERGIPVFEPFQGHRIGAFTVMSPSRSLFFDLVENSEKTPEQIAKQVETSLIEQGLKALATMIKRAWGDEAFSTEETSCENEMSVVQWANLKGDDVVFTGDAGRRALHLAADFAPSAGLILPGIAKFQVPHHGSRRNVDSSVLDRWLGSKKIFMPRDDEFKTKAYVCASDDDKDHPRNAVIRAFMHRGATVTKTIDNGWLRTGRNAPVREGTRPVEHLPYPGDQEEG